MQRKVVTCPETAQPEEIELETTPLGRLILGCTRFLPRCNLECARGCAARLDREDPLDVEIEVDESDVASEVTVTSDESQRL